LGDADLIKNQVKRLDELNNSRKDKIVYFNSLYIPASKDYANIIMDSVKDSRGVINQLFYSFDNKGLSFSQDMEKQGYVKLIDKPEEIWNIFIKG
jgi:hypothetical protein